MSEGKAPSAEDFAAEYLRLLDEGWTPDLGEYLERVPEALREDCRRNIEELHRLRGALDDAGERATAPEGPPEIAGFRIEGELGQGALGRVYAAWDETLQRKVALKVLHESVRGHILEEARKAAALDDPSIVTIHSVTDAPAIVMEYVDGHPIDQAAAPLTYRQRARILLDVARALATAHAHGIIHRDLKPENILVTPDHKPKILDFGLAISSDAAGGDEGGFVGTPLYASPEQAAGHKLSTASDIFSLGSVMFHVLTGEPPFRGADVADVLGRIQTSDPPFPRAIDPSIPEDLQTICLACMARDPGERPTARDVVADLGRFLAGEPARFRPALYRDTLQSRVSEHMSELAGWEEQGMISLEEADRLTAVYRRILAPEDPWVFDARRLSFLQVLFYATAWACAVGTALFVWYSRDFSPAVRWAVPAGFCAALLALGIRARMRGELLGAVAYLGAGTLAVVPAMLAVAAEFQLVDLWQVEAKELFEDPALTNVRILIASGTALAVSLLLWGLLRLTAFAWTSAMLIAWTYFSVLLTRNVLAQEPEIVALWLLPLIALESVALACEAKGRVRWALPYDLIALVALIGCLDTMAVEGKTFELLGVPLEGRELLAFALNGLILLVLTVPMERSKSLALRRAARLLQLLIPLHLLPFLFFNAADNKTWGDIGLYIGAVVLLLALGPWRARHWFLTGGLGGIAFGSYLLLDLGKVSQQAFPIALCAAGLAGAFVTYVYLQRRSR